MTWVERVERIAMPEKKKLLVADNSYAYTFPLYIVFMFYLLLYLSIVGAMVSHLYISSSILFILSS